MQGTSAHHNKDTMALDLRIPVNLKKTTENTMQAALKYLNHLIAQGWEYPDAHAKAATTHRVDAVDLQAEYDRQFL